MSRPKRRTAKSRLNMEVSYATRERLEQMVIDTEADSMSEVLRRALALYETLVRETNSGAKIMVRPTNGNDRELMIY